MTIYKKVRSTVCPQVLVIDEKSVWENTNIKKVEVEHEGEKHTEYEFDQKRYTKNEYIALLKEQNAELEAQLTDTQLALCEVYELML